MLKSLLLPANRRGLCKVLFASAWEESFRDAFGDTAEVEEALVWAHLRVWHLPG